MRFSEILLSLDGRINRKQFWLGLLFIVCFAAPLFFAAYSLFSVGSQIGRAAGVILFFVTFFAFIWTIWALSLKRWHDLNLSGMMNLLWLIPFIGPAIVITILGFAASQVPSERRRRRRSRR